MLSLTKKTDYALIALGHLAERSGGTLSAREIALAYQMPSALVMNILKSLHHAGLVSSTRGLKGGYRLAADLAQTSLYDLIKAVEGPVRLAECITIQDDCHEEGCCKISRGCPIRAPIRALHGKLIQFLKDVKLADIVVPGRRIDVPVELVGLGA